MTRIETMQTCTISDVTTSILSGETSVGNPIYLSATVTPAPGNIAGGHYVKFIDIDTNKIIASSSTPITDSIYSTEWIPTTGRVYHIKATTSEYNYTYQQTYICESPNVLEFLVQPWPIPCTSISLTSNKKIGTVGDIIVLEVSTYPIGIYTIIFTINNINIDQTCYTSISDGKCHIYWNTYGLDPGVYNIKTQIIGQCISNIETIELLRSYPSYTTIGVLTVIAIFSIIYLLKKYKRK